MHFLFCNLQTFYVMETRFLEAHDPAVVTTREFSALLMHSSQFVTMQCFALTESSLQTNVLFVLCVVVVVVLIAITIHVTIIFVVIIVTIFITIFISFIVKIVIIDDIVNLVVIVIVIVNIIISYIKHR